jgi:putative salt-induced outer membrane protein
MAWRVSVSPRYVRGIAIFIIGASFEIAVLSPCLAQDTAPPVIEAMLREALESERQTVKNILKRLYPDYITEIDALVDRIEDEEEELVERSNFFEGWVGEGAFGADLSRGNVDEWGVNASLSVKRKGIDWDHEFQFKIDLGELQGERTDERISVSLASERKISEEIFAFGFLQYERDRLQDIDRRFTQAIGVGYEILDTDKFDWTVRTGPALRQTRFRNLADEDRLGIVARTDFDWEISDTLDFSQSFSGIIDEGNSTFVSQTAFTASIYGRLSARFSVEVETETDPPEGAENTDVFTRGSIVYGF